MHLYIYIYSTHFTIQLSNSFCANIKILKYNVHSSAKSSKRDTFLVCVKYAEWIIRLMNCHISANQYLVASLGFNVKFVKRILLGRILTYLKIAKLPLTCSQLPFECKHCLHFSMLYESSNILRSPFWMMLHRDDLDQSSRTECTFEEVFHPTITFLLILSNRSSSYPCIDQKTVKFFHDLWSSFWIIYFTSSTNTSLAFSCVSLIYLNHECRQRYLSLVQWKRRRGIESR